MKMRYLGSAGRDHAIYRTGAVIGGMILKRTKKKRDGEDSMSHRPKTSNSDPGKLD